MSIRDERHPGYFYYCQSGSKLTPSAKAGLGLSSLALKIAYQINCLDRLSESELRQWTDHIRAFQRWPWGRLAGLFEDKAIIRVLDRQGGRNDYGIQVRRAETRQSCAALLGVGSHPRWSIRAIPRTKRQVIEYIDSLPWHLPWGAASQATHLVFFLNLNADLFGQAKAQQELIPTILATFDELQDKETGTWFRGNTSPEQMVNGAMKVLTAYALLDKEFAYLEKLIDFCLAVSNDQDACHNVDILYVLHQCSRWTDYRRQDIEDFAAQRVDVIRTHYKPDGAFSFFPEHTGTHYYGVEMSEPRAESDVHGTHLLVWGLTMAGELLGFNQDLGWQMPIT
ncbi:MAG: hypothetical protein OEW09_19035 [Anaerolineae bacterium]|nr:hypothetical protein [Anaerolineae bacterium]